MNSDTVLRSKDLAELAGTTPRALRHYHQIGLLTEPPRDTNGYRRYSATDLVRVLRIRQFADSGVPLRRVGELLKADDTTQDVVLDELDQDLARQATRIATQRATLARLRQRYPAPATKTRQLDEQLWTLLHAHQTDPAALTGLSTVASTVQADTGQWYAEFERLETSSEISEAAAQDLSAKMVEFYRRLEVSPTPDARFPLLDFAPELVRRHLSPAQYRVWRLFLTQIGEHKSF